MKSLSLCVVVMLQLLLQCGDCLWHANADSVLYDSGGIGSSSQNNNEPAHEDANGNSLGNIAYPQNITVLEPPGVFRQSRRSAISDACTTNDGTSGTCLTRFNCMRQGGVPKGFCSTYGVCCETNLQCGQLSRLKRTIIKNPAQLTQAACQYIIAPYSNNVCQLLIEFQRFELQQPQVDQPNERINCVDAFTVGNFVLCGENSGQHIYLPFNAAGGVAQVALTFTIPTLWAQSTWYLVVTQLECPAVKRRIGSGLMPFLGQNNLQDLRTIFSTHNSDLDLLAPPGCDQYYTQPTGLIKSFNYRDGMTTYYLPNLKYTICVKHIPGATMIEYTVNRFSLSAEVPGMFYDEFCHPSIYTEFRHNDYLMIPQSFFADAVYNQPTYFCGTGLTTGQVLIATAPYIMYFSSDDQWSAAETGFSITYRVKTTL